MLHSIYAVLQSRGIELARLAVQYSTATERVDIHILGCDDVSILTANMAAATSAPTETEQELVKEIQQTWVYHTIIVWKFGTFLKVGEYVLIFFNWK